MKAIAVGVLAALIGWGTGASAQTTTDPLAPPKLREIVPQTTSPREPPSNDAAGIAVDNAGLFERNMYLAEDRILCFEIVTKRHEGWVYVLALPCHPIGMR